MKDVAVLTPVPRGALPAKRPSFDRRYEEFRFLADECLPRGMKASWATLERMNLPVQDTKLAQTTNAQGRK